MRGERGIVTLGGALALVGLMVALIICTAFVTLSVGMAAGVVTVFE